MNKEFICDCGGVMESKKVTKKIPFGKEEILLEDVDAKVCQKCAEIYFDGKMILAIESKIKERLPKVA
ncbi:MAG TPA: YgiT-type zinc finger protein [Pyrinomonadaceae bacterium]|jgi:YgiT-type zinc finger domain-containing protein